MAKVATGLLTLFTIGGKNFLCQVDEVKMTSEIEVEDGSCINESADSETPVGRKRTLTGSGAFSDYPEAMLIIESATPVVAFTYETGPVTYAGNLLMKMAEHSASRRQFQKQSFTASIQGTPTITKN